MRIGVLTGGGDVPGLNAAIRAVARRAFEYGYEVLGIRNGWGGLLEGDMESLDLKSVSGILHVGGTILGTSRANPLRREGGFHKYLGARVNGGLSLLKLTDIHLGYYDVIQLVLSLIFRCNYELQPLGAFL